MQEGEHILREGEPVLTDSRFFIIEEGAVECHKVVQVQNLPLESCMIANQRLHMAALFNRSTAGEEQARCMQLSDKELHDVAGGRCLLFVGPEESCGKHGAGGILWGNGSHQAEQQPRS